MKILRDTRIGLVSHVSDKQEKRIFSALNSLQIDVEKVAELPDDFSQSYPCIWLIAVADLGRLNQLNIRSFHANTEAFIYLVDKVEYTAKDSNVTCLPLNVSENHLLHALLAKEQLIMQRNLFCCAQVNEQVFEQQHFYGRSDAFQKAAEVIKQFAVTEESVFIKGETGTGKELTARAIHYLSARNNCAFIPINCGAFTDDLILSELFGYEKGSFTGATRSKRGLLEIADKGTVFLDEVDSLSSKAQVSLLRFLQDSEIRPIGSNDIKKVDVRVVAASNQNIKSLVKNGKFREDLMYRLDVLSLQLPRLQERDEDIQLLAQYYLAKVADEYDAEPKVFGADVLEYMQNYEWPGNVRELENFVKRTFLLSRSNVIHHSVVPKQPISTEKLLSALPSLVNFKHSFGDEKKLWVDKFEKDYLVYVLCKTKGNITKAAQIAQKERRSFCRLMEKHGLTRKQFL